MSWNPAYLATDAENKPGDENVNCEMLIRGMPKWSAHGLVRTIEPGCNTRTKPSALRFAKDSDGMQKGGWSERQDLNLRRLGPKPSALARLSYAPRTGEANIH